MINTTGNSWQRVERERRKLEIWKKLIAYHKLLVIHLAAMLCNHCTPLFHFQRVQRDVFWVIVLLWVRLSIYSYTRIFILTELFSVFSTITLGISVVNLKWYRCNRKPVEKEEENYEILFDLSGSQFDTWYVRETKWTFLPLTFHFKVNYCYIVPIISFPSDLFSL